MKWRLALLALALLVLAGSLSLTGSSTGSPLRYAIHTVRIDDRPMRLVAGAGLEWIVQLLSWREIEPSPGELYWEYPDSVLRAAEHYQIKVVFRVDKQPDWARRGRMNAPPNDESLYPAFLAQVAERYRGRVSAYVVWNEPNLAEEWGGDPPDPEAYARLLDSAATAIRQADPSALVLSAGLAPTNEISARAMDDREFLRRQLRAPGGRSFDALAAHAYGFGLPPDAPRSASDGLNVRRVEQHREILVEAGLAQTSIWITELGWTVDTTSPVGAPAVSEEYRGRYLAASYAQAAREWPWVGMVATWSLGADEPDDNNQNGFRLAGPDYQPKPSWAALERMPKPGSSTGVRVPGMSDGGLTGPRGQPFECPGLGWIVLPGSCVMQSFKALNSRRPIEILAKDVPIHLGDQPDIGPPWRPVYGFAAVATSWRTEFYVENSAGDWQLALEALQPNDRGNRILINGDLLDPGYWPGRDWDFASYWTSLHFKVPSGTLRAGLNVLEVRVGQGVPAFQVANNRWEDLEFRGIRLTPTAPWTERR